VTEALLILQEDIISVPVVSFHFFSIDFLHNLENVLYRIFDKTIVTKIWVHIIQEGSSTFY